MPCSLGAQSYFFSSRRNCGTVCFYHCIKGKENGKTIMRASIIYTLYYWFMCMHWLKYVRLNRKDWLKNMRGTTLEVAMFADINGAYSAISTVYQCVTGPLWHQSLLFLLDLLDSNNRTLMARPLNLDDLLWITSQDVNLSIIMIICSFFNRWYI